MKGLSLVTVVFGLTCINIHAYPVWNEQKGSLEDKNPQHAMNYSGLKDSELLGRLVRGESKLLKSLRDLVRKMDNDYMDFLAKVQSLKSLNETVSISGPLARILGRNEISAATAIYVYQIMFSEEDDDLGKDFDEYAKGIILNPFE